MTPRLRASLCVLLGVFTLGSSATAADARPNVVIFLADDLGWADVGFHGEEVIETPSLDRLAAEGVQLDRFYTTPICSPTRAALMTGRDPMRLGVAYGVIMPWHTNGIHPDELFMPEAFRRAGYQTAMVGKWHLGMDFPGDRNTRDWRQPVKDMPLDKGFDYFWGIPASMNYGVLAWFEGRHAKVPPTQYTQKKPNKIALSDYRIMPPYEKTAKVSPAGKTGKQDILFYFPVCIDCDKIRVVYHLELPQILN